MSDTISKVEDAYLEGFSAWNPWYQEAEMDDRMYLNDQWDTKTASDLLRDDRVVLSINKCKKPIDLVTGHEQQNRTDIKYRPWNADDQWIADIYSELSKFVITKSFGANNISIAFADAARVGLGWVSSGVSYVEEPFGGKVDIGFENKYRMMMDPYTTSPTLEDCGWLIRSQWLHKDHIARLYPKHKKEIEGLRAGSSSKFSVQRLTDIQDRRERAQVIELWEREHKKKILVHNVVTQETKVWPGGRAKLEQLKRERPEAFEYLVDYERFVPEMSLTTIIADQIVAHEGKPPKTFSQTNYPFFPIFGYYLPTFTEWRLKLQGIIRVMRDPQKELNKARSLQMEAYKTVPSTGWIHEAGVVANPKELRKVGNRQNIEVKRGKGLGNGLWQVPAPQIQNAFAMLENLSKEDISDAGPHPDLWGQIGNGGSSADASGAALQQRVKQSLTSIHNIYDSKTLTMKLLGRDLVEKFNKWPRSTIERIIGKPLPKEWDEKKLTSDFDVVIDEITNSSTYRMANFAQLQSLVAHGVQIPQSVLKETIDLPADVKEKWDKDIQQQQQSEMQKRQQDMQLEEKRIAAMYQGELQKVGLKNQGDKEVEGMGIQGDKEIKKMDIAGKMALEKIKQGQSRSRWQQSGGGFR